MIINNPSHASEIKGVHNSNISRACNIPTRKCSGFYWSYQEVPIDFVIPEHTKEEPRLKSKKVVQKDEKGIILKEFNSFKEASEFIKIDGSSISRSCNDPQKRAAGFYWSYV